MDDNQQNDDLDSIFDDSNEDFAIDEPDKSVDEPTNPDPEQPQPAVEPVVPEAEQAPAQADQQPQPEQQPVPPVENDQPQVQPETPKPLTSADIRTVMTEMQNEQRDRDTSIQTMEQDIISAYYPQGISNVLVDENTGKELRTPQDVVDASGGEMTHEEAAQWLMHKQVEVDKQVEDVKRSAQELAEVNYNFKDGAVRVIKTYQPIFSRYPGLQQRVYNNYMKTVKMEQKNVDGRPLDFVLSAPDIEDYYRDFMEPYVMAFAASQKEAPPSVPQPSVPDGSAKPTIPESRQTPADRMDVSGDAGGGAGGDEADPNDPESSLSKLFGE